WWSRWKAIERSNWMPLDLTVILAIAFVILFFASTIFIIQRYKRCPSDRILVVYGKVGGGKDGQRRSARCYHGGAAFIVPVFQNYSFLELTPTSIEINLQG